MPCFKGLAVSIHTPDGPISEYSIQKQSKFGRITTYIPVPKPKISVDGNAEQSTFAISITLLTPGLSVPYSTPKPTPENAYPRPQIVGAPPRNGEQGQYLGIMPYQSLTQHDNETVAAYIYFDGRAKEEVATLLRKGEETWVNSRWVGVPQSEGGGLAEREFLFKEVGLERWLNGLDLAGSKDAAEKVQRRKERLEKKRRKREKAKQEEEEHDEIDAANPGRWRRDANHQPVLRYGDDGNAPLQSLSDRDDASSDDDTDSDDDDDPLPASTGQIKVALFRVLASGEIKKGEYSPQFDAHDDSENEMKDGGDEDGEDIDHATSFAKPKTLDPKTISTQTVTGIDSPDKPYAVFTFLYRGEKQLQKMGILKPKKAAAPSHDQKRKSVQESVKGLGALKSGAAERFTGIRDTNTANGKRANGGDDMSDDDDDDDEGSGLVGTSKRGADKNKDDADDEDDNDDPHSTRLNPEDVKRQGELSSGVQKMRLKRQHSFELPGLSPDASHPSKEPSPTKDGSTTPPTVAPADLSATPMLPSTAYTPLNELKSTMADMATGLDKSMIGSPMKKARASLSVEEDGVRKARAEALAKGLGFGFSGEAAAMAATAKSSSPTTAAAVGSLESAASSHPLASSNSNGMFGGRLDQSANIPGTAAEASSKAKTDGMEEEL